MMTAAGLGMDGAMMARPHDSEAAYGCDAVVVRSIEPPTGSEIPMTEP